MKSPKEIINTYNTTKIKMYFLYNSVITVIENLLQEILRITRIILNFICKMYAEISPLFTIKTISKLLIQLAFLSKIIVTIPFLPISLEIKLLAAEYIKTLTALSSSIFLTLNSLLEFYKNDNHTALYNDVLLKEIQQLQEQIISNQKNAKEHITHLCDENASLKSAILLEQQKSNILTVTNDEFIQKSQKERLTTQVDLITKWLSLGSSTVIFLSTITNLSLNIYRIINGGFGSDSSSSDLKSSIHDLTKLLLALNRNNVDQTATNRTTGSPGISPGDIAFDDIDNGH